MDKRTMIENLAREACEKGGLNGAWLYAENGGIVSKGAMGWSDPDSRVPLTEDMVFDLASVSKQFTAAAIMLLRRRGLLVLDEDGKERTFRLYPIGEDEFGRKGGFLTVKFGGDCAMYDDLICRKR